MDPTRLRAEFRRRSGRELSQSDAQLSALIEAYGARRRRPVPVGDGLTPDDPVVRLSIPIPLGMPEGTGWPEDRAPARRGPEAGDEELPPDARPAPPVSELPIVRELRESMRRHPSARKMDAAPEYDRPDLSVVPDPDGPPTYGRPA